ncbi:DUF1073 domain-containing protein [Entomobacter blattae]|uniref:Anti-CBASS protein Acb1-like N-terminal domain-containing protein n=1 Tax=Entomobacter blattae TaxID=2762277 RepID=A0A7H1NR59_9PROT|nr:DUF1073 domain-containing protein [Entomobacter blattae]QNT78269.1 hypothetical protein JGUZn3_10410 [Entomobacter blattae]
MTALDHPYALSPSTARQQLFSEGIGFPGYPYLSALSLRGEYRNIVETIAREAVRGWGHFKGGGASASAGRRVAELEAAFRSFGICALMANMVRMDGYFGIGHLWVDVAPAKGGSKARSSSVFSIPDGEELATPLTLDRAKLPQGSLRGFRAIEPLWCSPGACEMENPLSPWYYRPQYWIVQNCAVHASRLLQFISRPLPDSLKPAYNFGGLPLTMMAKPYVDNYLRTRQSVSDLVHSFSTMVLKTDMAQLGNGLRNKGGNLRQRARLFTALRDNMGLMMLDSAEELKNVTTPLVGLDKLQAQSQEHIASICGIPLVKLTGITPSGLNASSDGELRVFYDTMAALRETLLTPAIEQISHMVMLHLWGEIDPTIAFEWEPLYALNRLERQTAEKVRAETASVRVKSGLTTPQQEQRLWPELATGLGERSRQSPFGLQDQEEFNQEHPDQEQSDQEKTDQEKTDQEEG